MRINYCFNTTFTVILLITNKKVFHFSIQDWANWKARFPSSSTMDHSSILNKNGRRQITQQTGISEAYEWNALEKNQIKSSIRRNRWHQGGAVERKKSSHCSETIQRSRRQIYWKEEQVKQPSQVGQTRLDDKVWTAFSPNRGKISSTKGVFVTFARRTRKHQSFEAKSNERRSAIQ